MTPLMQELKNLFQDCPLSCAEREELHKLERYTDKVEEVLSPAFVHDMMRQVAAGWSIEVDEYFERGFRLGVRLMLEVLWEPEEGAVTPPAPQPSWPDSRRRSSAGQ